MALDFGKHFGTLNSIQEILIEDFGLGQGFNVVKNCTAFVFKINTIQTVDVFIKVMFRTNSDVGTIELFKLQVGNKQILALLKAKIVGDFSANEYSFGFFVEPLVEEFNVNLHVFGFVNRDVSLKMTSDIMTSNVMSNDIGDFKFENLKGSINIEYKVLHFNGQVMVIPQFKKLSQNIRAEHSLLIYRLTDEQQNYLLSRNIKVEYLYD